MRRILWAVHRWLGLTVGIYFVLMGLTGALLVWHESVDASLNPRLMRVAPRPVQASPDAILASVKNAYPDAKIDRVVMPAHAGGTCEVRFKSNGERIKGYVDPHDGRFLGAREVKGYFMGFVLYLHMELMLGERGEWFSGRASLLVALLLFSGLIIWWPHNLKQLKVRLKVARGVSLKRRMHDLHNVFGIYSLPFLLLTTLTGTHFFFVGQTEAILNSVFGAAAPKPDSTSEIIAKEKPLSWNILLQRAQTAAPNTKIDRFYPTDERDEPVSARFIDERVGAGDSFITIELNPYTGQVLNINDTRKATGGERAMNWMAPLHFGRWGGLFSQILYTLVSLSPLSLFLTGLWKWNEKRRGRAKNRARHQLQKKEQLKDIVGVD